MLKKLSIVIGVFGVLLAMLPFVAIIVQGANIPFDVTQDYSPVSLIQIILLILIVPMLVFCVCYLVRAAVRKRPVIAGIALLIFIGLSFISPAQAIYIVPRALLTASGILAPALLIAASVLAFISAYRGRKLNTPQP